ncbi:MULTISPECIES: mechanosensitive ion channel family protein [Alphaproteobacteria]|uniref:mechanosensitive ion channel family protein n=1 Tax=Alphaproteobacteria TaxID=28211 RepID=UPI0012BCAABB|nr:MULTISPECIES: mechanosensitive ion channel domain-containing protein [Alphaproteobacteria]MTI01591.1 mechanosensitive ion channel family protein [Roseibium sp. RKSG952]
MFHPLRLVLALLAAICFAVPAFAQVPSTSTSSSAPAPVTIPDDLTPDQVDDLVARMSDDQVRSILLERLDAVAAKQAQAPAKKGLVTRVTETATAMAASWVDVIRKLPSLVTLQIEAITNFGKAFGSSGLMTLFGFTFLALAIGFAAEKIVGIWTRRWIKAVPGDAEHDLRGAVMFLIKRFCRELLGLVVFYYTLVFVGRQLLNPEQIAQVAPFVFFLIWFPRLGAAISRFVLAPERSELRLVNIDDHWAKYLHRNLIGLFLLIGFTMFIIRFNTLNGVEMGETRLGFWLNTSIHIYIGLIAWTARKGLSDMMRGTDPDRTEFDEWVAEFYPYFAIGVSFVMWFVVEYLAATKDPQLVAMAAEGAHFATMFWLLILPALDTLIRGLVRHLQPPIMGHGAIAERAYKSTKRSYIRIGRVLAGIFIVLMIANAWDLDLQEIAGAGTDAGGRVIQFFILVAFGYILNEVVSLWINRRLAKEETEGQSPDEEAGEGGGTGGSRLATVLPLLRVTAQVAIAVIFGLLALGALGMDITPLLAGAGILGLAIGFGAQKLVSDIVGGIFFLIDDAFRVGEYVDVGGTTGTVEKISIRSMQLRHHRGPVHTIPYGEIQKLTNYSRDWVIMKLKFTVPFDTDPNKVKKIFKKIGAEMMEDETHKDGFLQPFKSQGVFDFDDVGMIIRGKFMAKPGKQFTLRKEIFNRVKAAFKENGIDFARREVRVAIPGLEEAENLSDQQKAAIGAAASDAVNKEQGPA